MIDKCGIEPPGKLTIRGFSEKRESALLEYTTSNSGAGTPVQFRRVLFLSRRINRHKRNHPLAGRGRVDTLPESPFLDRPANPKRRVGLAAADVGKYE